MSEDVVSLNLPWSVLIEPAPGRGQQMYRRIRDLLEKGRWDEAATDLDRLDIVATQSSLPLRMFVAYGRKDAQALSQLSDELDFKEAPQAKLWGLRCARRPEDAVRLLSDSRDMISGSEGVLLEGLASAYKIKNWNLVLNMISLILNLRPLTPWEMTVAAEGLVEKATILQEEERLADAAEAYIASYHQHPNDSALKGLGSILMKRSDKETEQRIDDFARKQRAYDSDNSTMQLIGFVQCWHDGKWGHVVRITGRLVQRAVSNTLSRWIRGWRA